MDVVLPDFLRSHKINIDIDDLVFARYILREKQKKINVRMEKNTLIYVLRGQKIFHLKEHSWSISPGELLFLRRGEYSMNEILDDTYEAILLMYDDSTIASFIKKYSIDLPTQNQTQNAVHIPSNKQINSALLSLMHCFEDRELATSSVTKLKLEEMFLAILESGESQKFKDFLASICTEESAFEEILESFAESEESLRVPEMARAMKMSESAFRKRFQEIYKTTPKKWLVKKRLEKARLLLENSSMNVTEVCRESGFDNISWFIQLFKKEYGITPKQKNNKNH